MKNKGLFVLLLLMIIIFIVLGTIYVGLIFSDGVDEVSIGDFIPMINNKYFPLTPGIRYVYEGEVEEGIERTEVYVTEEKKEIMGVTTTVVSDRVWLNGELIEDTKDWFAQDIYGNVWYFGEESYELIDGKVVSTEGSWEAGVDDAKPGIIMEGSPKIGDVYLQEYYPGVAEDTAEVISLDIDLKVKYGSFENCLQTKEWNPLETDSEEYKYYCPNIGMVYEVSLEDEEGSQLVSIKEGPGNSGDIINEGLSPGITEEEAISIALKEVAGEVTGVEIERKFGKVSYVVEIDEKTDVIIDIDTGEVLGVEE